MLIHKSFFILRVLSCTDRGEHLLACDLADLYAKHQHDDQRVSKEILGQNGGRKEEEQEAYGVKDLSASRQRVVGAQKFKEGDEGEDQHVEIRDRRDEHDDRGGDDRAGEIRSGVRGCDRRQKEDDEKHRKIGVTEDRGKQLCRQNQMEQLEERGGQGKVDARKQAIALVHKAAELLKEGGEVIQARPIQEKGEARPDREVKADAERGKPFFLMKEKDAEEQRIDLNDARQSQRNVRKLSQNGILMIVPQHEDEKEDQSEINDVSAHDGIDERGG